MATHRPISIETESKVKKVEASLVVDVEVVRRIQLCLHDAS